MIMFLKIMLSITARGPTALHPLPARAVGGGAASATGGHQRPQHLQAAADALHHWPRGATTRPVGQSKFSHYSKSA